MGTLEQIESSAYSAYLNRLVAQELREKAAEVIVAAHCLPDIQLRLRLTGYAQTIVSLAKNLEGLAAYEEAWAEQMKQAIGQQALTNMIGEESLVI